MKDPQPHYNRGEDFNKTVEDIRRVAAHAIAMGDKTTLIECMETILRMCERTQTDPVE